MWQRQNSFRLDNRFVLRECEAAAAVISRTDSPASKLVSLASSGSCGLDSSDWQRAAALVQSPLSANSEGSSTSTPDQCPHSPALSFYEMPSSRNGSCNKQIRQKEMHQQHQQLAWNNLPSESPAPKSASLLDVESGQWSTRADGLVLDQSQDAYSNSILNSGQGYALDAPLVSRTSELMSRSCSEDTGSRSLQNPVVSPGRRGLSSMYAVEMQVIKQEEEFFLGGRNGLVIDDKVLALQRPSASCSSKIGNFMHLLRQADRPIPDATAATSASCSHLGQFLSNSQETPEMWLTRTSRLPAMLSEVLPSNSPGKSSDSFERNKRKMTELESRDHGSAVQLQEAVIPKHQDENEHAATSDRTRSLVGAGVTTSSSEPELFSKRPKIENSNSFPFKMQVRKEKLGERISALQQLVSPFGKTDTASVLLEAIGYIKFLHEQVQVLSSPYMKPNGASAARHSNELCEERQDLRSRGLCLVPVSCTLQVANDNGADYWAPTLHGLR